MAKVRTTIEIEDAYAQAIMERYRLRTETEAVDVSRPRRTAAGSLPRHAFTCTSPRPRTKPAERILESIATYGKQRIKQSTQLGMTDGVAIRPAREADCEFVVGLVPSLLRFGSPTWRDVEALMSGFGEVLARAVSGQEDHTTVLIAEASDHTPLGFISLKVVENIERGERGHVADLAVTEDARRVGVGTALMEAAEAWARDRGFDRLSLDVWSTNDAALAFYRHLGYTIDSLVLIKRLD